MKFMLMMNAPSGNGDWGISKWAPEDLKAHIGFMKKFTSGLAESGELVGAEGLALPAQAKLVRAGKDRRARSRTACSRSRRSSSPATGSWTSTRPERAYR